jgi:hypothetical protein
MAEVQAGGWTMKREIGAVFALLMPVAGHAASMDSMTFAHQLGTLIAGETVCELSFDQSAIEALINKRVKSDDMSFAATLTTMVQGSIFQARDFTATQRKAHCVQIARVAKSYGLIKP